MPSSLPARRDPACAQRCPASATWLRPCPPGTAAPPATARHRPPLAPQAARTAPTHRSRYAIYVNTQISVIPSEDEFQSAVGMLKLLGDETRLRIIWALLESEHSVNELAELVGANAAGVSQHLAKLRLARLVRTRRDGTRIFYSVDDAHVRSLVEDVLSHADHVTRTNSDRAGSVSSKKTERSRAHQS